VYPNLSLSAYLNESMMKGGIRWCFSALP